MSSPYEFIIEGMRWSYSRVNSFSQCPYGWFLKYLGGAEDEELFYASFGSFMHHLLERFYKGEATPDELEAEFFQDFDEKVIGERPKNIDFYIEQGSKFIRELTPLPYCVVDVEKFVRFEVGGKKFVGVIDLLVQDGDGEYVIIDHKSHKLQPYTGRKKPTKSDDELSQYLRQLYLYSAGVEQIYGKRPVKLCFNCFMNGNFIEVPFDDAVYETVTQEMVEEVRYIEKTDDFYPRDDWFYCRNLCGLHNSCVYYKLWRK